MVNSDKRKGTEPTEPIASLADAKSAENPVQQVVGVHRPDHLAEFVQGTAELQGKNLSRLFE